MKPNKAMDKVRKLIKDNQPVDTKNTLILVSKEVKTALMEYANKNLETAEQDFNTITIEEMPVVTAGFLDGEEIKLREEK